ncbi:MAG: alcohol dehydrogenase catalytic domain-containing protein [Chloroflexi bacterium]|nr:alcohol dehydrogenase catalytic domain-containing protein [Chloroflexota bacterium]
MLGLWLDSQRLTLRADLPVPLPPPGEALIRVLKAGICNTDIELTRGYYPYTGVLGHEFVGVVESEGQWKGRRVCGEINAACGQCEQCLNGRRTHCENRTVPGILNRAGAYAEYLTLPFENLHTVPDSVSDDEAVFTEPLAAALEIAQQIQIRPSDTVMVIGDGKLGLLCAQVLALTGSNLLALGRHRSKLDILAARGIRALLVDDAPAARVDIVVECTGSPAGFDLARKFLHPRGTLVLKSTYTGLLTVNMSRIVVDELTIVGSRCGPFAPALDLLARKLVDVRSLIHDRFPLSEAARAMDRAQEAGVLKVLLDIG